ncbi:MAG TPA: type II toxin-antitoxin system RelE/ParE family toxin [Rhizomicrobium sp.]|jgi:plasmid stabilization system protein ParE|nr:type II toxin-antitoxin system RelE/ParE family toxin [Rhizomicrobium sp.]
MSATYLVVSETAERDIDDIAMYIAADNVQSALRFEAELNTALARLQAFPAMGRVIVGSPALRVMRVSSRFRHYLIVYRWDDPTVEILRLLHDAMDIRARLDLPDADR